ncbi:CPBP family intramembrane glutamic endopeptidase [Bacillus sp. FJAT-49736]|uniref:CPBP family intramembrane glutamic endopeptidase n=1 Tax=Bacillus sp. FJAT-49736 TaxID=2833582 RepID=UPI001BC92386|nr:CPBP family intramembrane glutamic endopeptidase [Bacillus sp. FJAT-49736]MBS4173311.1 CPBP family intramembrane metalloprotease [Bacillus sp. FJAT-49736]
MKKWNQANIIQQLSKKELTFHLVTTQLVLLTISVLLGIFLFKDFSAFFNLFRFDSSIYLIGITNGVLIVLLDLIFMKVLPDRFYDDGGINERIFQDRSIMEIIGLTILIAFSEEILFRGVIQTHFGIIAASIIFALVHIRYWGHWFLILNIVILSFWIGIVYEWSNHHLLTTISMHFIIDLLLGIAMKYRMKR